MAHLSEEQNERLRNAMQAVINERFHGVRKRLAEAMGVSAPSLADFMNRKGGASHETAELFAARIARKPIIDVIGPRALNKPATPRPAQGFLVSPDVRRRAAILLRQKPFEFEQEAIDIGFDCIVIGNAEDARNPATVANLVRIAILGNAAQLPKVPPSSAPPAGTRRSRRQTG